MQNLNDLNKPLSGVLESEMNKYEFILYIAGSSIISSRAISNAKNILGKYLNGRYKLDVVDINEHPEIVITESIITIPLLIKKEPIPECRVTGDLSDENKVLHALLIN